MTYFLHLSCTRGRSDYPFLLILQTKPEELSFYTRDGQITGSKWSTEKKNTLNLESEFTEFSSPIRTIRTIYHESIVILRFTLVNGPHICLLKIFVLWTVLVFRES